ncbi:Expansin-A6 [Zea mays]|uniref:Expansin-A6 n=1 Tax=Zea mays TaxID=4577 RepID=A0A1D6GE44_MAIZE|nr:Expansin-A6 [Zea mays]
MNEKERNSLTERRKRVRACRRRLRLRQPVQPGVRREQRGAEHGAVQPGAELRRVLRDQVRGPARVAVVPPGEPLHPGDGHQLLPAQLRAALRRRRLVQPAPPPLRPRHAHVPPHRRVPRRHRPRHLPPGAVPQVRRRAVHHQRLPVLQPGADHERGRRGGRGAREREGVGHGGVDAHVAELGPELAVQRHPRRPGALLPRHRQRPPHLHLLERRPAGLALRTDLRGQELQGLSSGREWRREEASAQGLLPPYYYIYRDYCY